jgi:hypothetical protein
MIRVRIRVKNRNECITFNGKLDRSELRNVNPVSVFGQRGGSLRS